MAFDDALQESERGIFCNRFDRHGHAGRISERQIALGGHGLGGGDFQLARLAVALDHRDAGDAVALHQSERVGERRLRADGERIHHHAGFEFLHPADVLGLFLGFQVPVDDSHATRLGHRDGEPGLGDRVHGGGKKGDAQLDALGQARPRIHLARQHI